MVTTISYSPILIFHSIILNIPIDIWSTDINWMQAFQMLMNAFLSTLTDKLSLTSGQLDGAIYVFIF